MKRFHIFRHPTLDLYESVKHGWSWPGFLGGGPWAFGIWAFVKRLWRIGAIIFVAGAVCVSVPEALGELAGLVMLGGSIAVGVLGNEWWANDLRRRGYEEVGMATSDTPDGAIETFVDGQKGPRHAPPPELK